MAVASYPFIDLAVLDGVREHLADGSAVLVLNANLDNALLANAAGARFAGFDGPFDLVGQDPELGASALRQLRSLELASDIGKAGTIALRLVGGVESRMAMVKARSILLPGGEPAIVLSSANALISADAIIEGLAGDGTHFAVLDAAGTVVASSAQFDDLKLAEFDLALLASEAAREKDRLVKRRIKAGNRFVPVGIGRLRDDPAAFILLVIAETEADSAPVVTAQSDEIAIEDTFERAHVSDESAQVEAPAIPIEQDLFYAGEPEIFTQVIFEAPAAEAVETEVEPIIIAQPMPEEAVKSVVSTDVDFQSFAHDPESAPVRFTWKIDADGKFSFVSPELATAVGSQAAAITGRTFKEVANVFAFDTNGEISDLLARRDTWSGRSLLWPIEGTDLRAPVDLAALPVYNRDRQFEGFRGFGIVRTADAIVDPEGLGLALVRPIQPLEIVDTAEDVPLNEDWDLEDPWRGEVPALAPIQPATPSFAQDDKIVQLEDRRQPRLIEESIEKSKLTPIERNAFREIADRLRREGVVSSDTRSTIAEASEETVASDAQSVLSQANAPEVLQDDISSSSDVETATDFAYGDEIEEDFDTTSQDIADLERLDQTPGEDFISDDDNNDYRLVFDESPEIQPDTKLEETPILSKLPVPVLIHNGANLLYGNPAFFELTRYTSLDDLEREGGIERLFHVSDTDSDDAADPMSRILTADNAERAVRAHLYSVKWKGASALLLSLRPMEELGENAADQSQSVMELQREVSELSSVLETATDGVVFLNADGTIRAINQSAEALFGFDPAMVSGKPFTHLFATESQRAASDYLSNLGGTGVASIMNDGREVIGREAHGRFIPLFMTIGKLDNDSGYCAVLRDITQWKRAEEELNAARRAAEHASTQKSEFLARVSHEIRTPLNAIIGFSDMMSEERFGPVGNARYLDYLRDINRSGKHVLDLVNDLLDISKIEAGQQEMDFEAVSLNDALSEAVSIMQPQANRERVIIRSSFATELPDVVADLRSIKQIALNLLSNAVRYTGAGGQVIISTSYELTGGVTVRVRDTGVGMSAQDIEQAMKPFKQINTLKRERGDGTGLGLPLTKAMVEANRANFIITSAPGQGTLVEITFPSTRVLAD